MLVVGLVGLLWPLQASAQSGGPELFRLSWSAPEECPSDTEVRQELQRLLGASTASPGGRVDATARVSAVNGGFELEIALGQDDQLRTRRLSAPRCTELGHAAALIADVQRALQRGDATAALGVLARYDAEFPRGALAEEASAARAVSWCKLGTKAPARQALNAFRSNFSSSPLAARVSAACRSLDGHVDFELEPEGSATQSGKRSAGSSAGESVNHE